MEKNLFINDDFIQLLKNKIFHPDNKYGLTDDAFVAINKLKDDNKLFKEDALALIERYISTRNQQPNILKRFRAMTRGRPKTAQPNRIQANTAQQNQLRPKTAQPNPLRSNVFTNDPLGGPTEGTGTTMGGRLHRTLKRRRKTANKR